MSKKEIIVDDKYTVYEEDGIVDIYRNGEKWKDGTKFELAMAQKIEEQEKEIKRLEKQVEIYCDM